MRLLFNRSGLDQVHDVHAYNHKRFLSIKCFQQAINTGLIFFSFYFLCSSSSSHELLANDPGVRTPTERMQQKISCAVTKLRRQTCIISAMRLLVYMDIVYAAVTWRWISFPANKGHRTWQYTTPPFSAQTWSFPKTSLALNYAGSAAKFVRNP